MCAKSVMKLLNWRFQYWHFNKFHFVHRYWCYELIGIEGFCI